jgi:hypothetical protein
MAAGVCEAKARTRSAAPSGCSVAMGSGGVKFGKVLREAADESVRGVASSFRFPA